MCLKFNSCSELFNAICKYFNLGLLRDHRQPRQYAGLLKCKQYETYISVIRNATIFSFINRKL